MNMRSCTRCLDVGHSVTAGAVFSGTVGARMMLVGQAPGPAEAVSGIPFCGPSGRRLFRWLADVGWQEDEFRRTQYITAITKCFPGKGKGGRGDRVPTAGERRLCGPVPRSGARPDCAASGPRRRRRGDRTIPRLRSPRRARGPSVPCWRPDRSSSSSSFQRESVAQSAGKPGAASSDLGAPARHARGGVPIAPLPRRAGFVITTLVRARNA